MSKQTIKSPEQKTADLVHRYRTRPRRFASITRDLHGNRIPSRTKQSHRDECDINVIMKKFESTGQLPDMIKEMPQYGDFADAPDYLEALNTVQHAQNQFAALSATVRDRFANSPENFLAFASDPRNLKEMEKLGLLKKTPSEGNQAPSKKSPEPAAGEGPKT